MTDDRTSVFSVTDLLGQVKGDQNGYLIVIRAKSQATVGKMIRLDQPETVLGRGQDVMVQIEDDGISRTHAKVTVSPDGGFRLLDLNSTNGTYLNDVEVLVADLKDGDKIQIGSNTILKFTMQDQLEEAYQKDLYESATRDGLTRIFNKKYFMDALNKEFAYCLRHDTPLSVLMLDVDHFKKINDTHGHPAGDYVLQQVAARITDAVRTEDLVARYGGEEFALMLRQTGAEKALRCAERCRLAVNGTALTFNDAAIPVSISAGVSTLFNSNHASPADLIATADKYLYRAKHAGRNRIDALQVSGV